MDLSGYKDLGNTPLSLSNQPQNDEQNQNNGGVFSTTLMSATAQPKENSSRPVLATAPSLNDRGVLHQLSPETYSELNPSADSEFSGNVQTLIRLVNELPEGVTKQTGAQIIRLTMEAMGISMEDVLSDAQSAQSDMLDAVRANIKKIEEYKTVIRKLETDIKFYQGKANELSEIIDLFILSNPSSSSSRMSNLEAMSSQNSNS